MNPLEIVIHHSEGTDGPEANVPGIFDWHIEHNHWLDVGYHALVEKIGPKRYFTILGRPWNMNGAHTIDHNAVALGICLVGDFMHAAPPAEQLVAAVKTVNYWMNLFKIPPEKVFRHKDLNATDCPGALFPWDKFKSMLVYYG